MNLIQAIVLGITQGLTEFIPVSSSGHLTLVPFTLGWKEPSITFIVAMHIGTLLAVVFVLRAAVGHLLRTLVRYKSASVEDQRLLRTVIIATIPAVLAGVAFDKLLGNSLERPVIVSLLLGVTGYWLISSEARRLERELDPIEAQTPLRTEYQLDNRGAALIGLAQAIAILPGVSRSGSTIGAGMRVGMTREGAVRFSFLMSIPVIFGAIIFKIPDMLSETGAGQAGEFAVGILASAITGFFAVKWTIGLVARRGLRGFGVYCFVAMAVGLIVALARG